MAIAILGWGSLIWDKDKVEANKFDKWCEGQWELAEGLELPLEFSRISTSREKVLTLVIDKDHGTICTVQYITSKRKELNDVICDLRCREGTVWRHIGCWSNDGRPSDHSFSDHIGEWAHKANFDAVVWTALPSNYRDKKKEEFSVKSAIRHLKGLSPEGKNKAEEYITKAPDGIRTKLRDKVKADSPFD